MAGQFVLGELNSRGFRHVDGIFVFRLFRGKQIDMARVPRETRTAMSELFRGYRIILQREEKMEEGLYD